MATTKTTTAKKTTSKKANLKIVEKKVSAERKTLYTAVMNNLRPLYTVNGEVITKVGDIPLELLEIDPSYQGYRVHNKINQLIANWDWRKLDLITLVPHPETCSYSVVDGQGRTLAAKALNLTSLSAKVLLDAPSDPIERLRYEADIFVRQDDQEEKLRAVEKHLALTLVDDPTALIMNKVMKKYHVSFVNTAGRRVGRVLGSYQGTFDIAKAYGEDALEYIFSIIENAGWGECSNAYATGTMWALKVIYTVHDDKRNETHKYLSTVLREFEPITMKAKAMAKYPARDYRQALSMFFEDLLIDAYIIDKATYKESLSAKAKRKFVK